MNIRTYILFLILYLGITETLFAQPTVSSEICLTPKEYRFYADALIDSQVLKKDSVRLGKAIRAYIFASAKDSLSIVQLNADLGLCGEKEAIYTHKITLLQDDLDSSNKKKILNRKFAIAGWGTITFEVLVIGAYFYLKR